MAADLHLDVGSTGTPPTGVDGLALRRRTHPLTGRHALVVGINYAPEPTGIAPYTTGMAEHLARHARTLSVLTGVPHYPSWTRPPEYRWALRRREQVRLTDTSGVHLQRLRHYVPQTQTAITRAAYEATFLAHAATTRPAFPPDLVVAVTPSLGGAVAGAHLAKRYGAELLVVVQDLMAKAAGQSGITGGGRVARATAALERSALRAAGLVAVVSDAFRDQLHDYGVPAERIRLLPNWAHIARSDATTETARQALGWPQQPFTLVHTGNIGLKQDLGNLVEAARQCADDDSLRFVIVGDGSQRAAVRAQAAGLANLHFVDPLDDAQYPLALAAADLLVVNERPTVGDMSLPSKITSYLTAGRPVLAAVSPDGATARELARTGGAAVIVPPGRPERLAQAARRLRDDADARSRMARLGSEYARLRLGPAAAMARLDAIVAELLEGR